ncbi:MAG: amidotransferase 1, exosortase A system-associated [Burkholderiales bacterium]|nr:amidotransferase 1, exosortase A system-associated [Burkholderiales bacterium]OJX08659.1 MAG: asparagine synthetase B [Burkholderiales bacterium 70-64]
MCGITGIFDPRAPSRPDEALLRRMNDMQLHRGPDEGSVHIEPHLGLGHRRLSIIDVATGQQPLFNEDGSVVVVFNGEIYNFQALAGELEAAGHVFRTRSDTEVIVHGWEQWGEACVGRFRGMFAFALWDRNRQTLFMARDRLGVKPLHYAVLGNGQLAFGSELKTLVAHPAFARELDERAIEDYFTLGYIPDPRTIYRGAAKLAPAHTLTWRVGEHAPRLARYWDARFEPDERITLADACEQLRVKLAESVKLRLISEVPLGAFLSGGVDSSAVVATMAQLSDAPVKTCSIGFDVASFNESEFAQKVAERYRTDHYTRTVHADDFGLIDRLASLYDEPYADSSAIPTYRVCELARTRVTVALSGDGGDETFGGYRRYKFHVREQALRDRLPAGLRHLLFGALGRLYPKFDRLPRMFRARATFQALARDAVDAYYHAVSIVRDDDRSLLFSPGFRARLGGYRAREVFHEHAARAQTDDPLSLIQYLDYQTYLPGDINTKVDRASMAHSLETREPLMDHELVEWAARLPSQLKLAGGEGKLVLKKAMEPLLPDDVLYRPKMGFAVPLADWFRGPLRAEVQRVLNGETLARTGIFDTRTLARVAEEHLSGRRDRSAMIWTLLMFERFMTNLEGQPSDSPLRHGIPEEASHA